VRIPLCDLLKEMTRQLSQLQRQVELVNVKENGTLAASPSFALKEGVLIAEKVRLQNVAGSTEASSTANVGSENDNETQSSDSAAVSDIEVRLLIIFDN